jgi:uncharacterized protein (UPF0332 family)
MTTRSELAMKVTAKELRQDAEILAIQTDSEARRRSAISRAYYAAYHRCKRWESLLPNRPIRPKTISVHASLIDSLNAPDPRWDVALVERSRALGALLEKQRKRRVLADYNLGQPVDKNFMEEQFVDVRKTFATCADSQS